MQAPFGRSAHGRIGVAFLVKVAMSRDLSGIYAFLRTVSRDTRTKRVRLETKAGKIRISISTFYYVLGNKLTWIYKAQGSPYRGWMDGWMDGWMISFTPTPRRSDMQATTTIYIRRLTAIFENRFPRTHTQIVSRTLF